MATPDPPLHPETRLAFLDAGLACFAKYGFDGTSIRLIATEAGKNSSLIAYYFKSKEGLYREVFKHLLTLFCPTEALTPERAATLGAEGARARLRAHFLYILTEVEAHRRSTSPLKDRAAHLFMSELHAPRPEVRDLIQATLEPSVQEFRACIRGLRPDLPGSEVDFWGITLQGACLAHGLRHEINRLVWTEADPALALEAMAERLTDFACRGLPAPQPQTPGP